MKQIESNINSKCGRDCVIISHNKPGFTNRLPVIYRKFIPRKLDLDSAYSVSSTDYI
jgi:hypothetical protein